MLARTMSYAMMLGDIKEARHVVKTLNLPIQPVKWYDPELLTLALCKKYNMNHH